MVRDLDQGANAFDMSNLDKSLDDLIKSDKGQRNQNNRGRGGSSRGGNRGSPFRRGGGSGTGRGRSRGRGGPSMRGRGGSNMNRHNNDNNNQNNNNRHSNSNINRGKPKQIRKFGSTRGGSRGMTMRGRGGMRGHRGMRGGRGMRGNRSFRGNRGNSGPRNFGNRGGQSGRGTSTTTTTMANRVRTNPGGTILIEGLQSHVTSDDIKEIFEREGTITQAFVNFDKDTGKSTGTASVVYAQRSDAKQAQRSLNGAKIDNKPVRVKLVSSPMRGGMNGRGRGRGVMPNRGRGGPGGRGRGRPHPLSR